MPKCLIIEDEPLARDILESYLEEFPEFELIATCSRAEDARAILQSEAIDLIFLDINLPDLSGLSFYKSLIRKPKLIFTTAYAEFAVEGFELEALDYLLKPFSFDRFKKALEKVESPAKPNSEFIMLKADKRIHKIDFSAICYFEAKGDFVKVILEEGKNLIIADSLKNLEKLLPQSFIRCHKSYIISLPKLQYLEGNQLKLKEAMIPIGPAYREKLQEGLKPG